MNEFFKQFLIQCGNQYMADNILDMPETIAIDNFLDYVFEKLEEINELQKLRRRDEENS